MSSSTSWAHTHLSALLPLDPESISQILTYTSTLPKPAAAEHLKNLLGDTPQALEFISSYNARREGNPLDVVQNGIETTMEDSGAREEGPEDAPQKARKQRKKQPGLGKLPPPRQVEGAGNTQGAYRKGDVREEYMPSSRLGGSGNGSAKPGLTRNTFALSTQPAAVSGPIPKATGGGTNERSKPPPSAQGSLLQDLKNVRMKAASPAQSSTNASRNASPAPSSATKSAAKVTLQGGKPMRGASTTLSDLDAAIRALEISTNPTLSSSTSDNKTKERERQCNCVAARHPLLAAAPNCLHCGKVICVKQGLGPCTFCGRPLLSQSDIQAMIRELRAERGHERQEANNQAKRRADVSGGARPFQSPSSGTITPSNTNENNNSTNAISQKLDLAKAHRDKLLSYQAQNARRTTLHDEAADYDAQPVAGSASMQWANPVERAKRLKQQQAILREQEWNAKPEYEKRQMVVSLDVDAGGKARATRKMVGKERPKVAEVEATTANASGEEDARDAMAEELDDEREGQEGGRGRRNEGVFARNPLLTGGLVRPTYPSTSTSKDKGKEKEVTTGSADDHSMDNTAPPPTRREKEKKWRRIVQDDDSDNEAQILDGGRYGRATSGAGREDERRLGVEEHAFG